MTTAHKRILVVEDDAALRRVVAFNLEQAGLEVTLASNGADAFALTQTDTFDVIVSDEQMPQMTGTQLLAELRRDPRYEHTPFVLLTGKLFELQGQLQQVTQALPKPFSPSHLTKLVQECLT